MKINPLTGVYMADWTEAMHIKLAELSIRQSRKKCFDHYEALRLRRNGLSFREIGKCLGISHETARCTIKTLKENK